VEDFYTTGAILHKGFYEDGQLKVFKNFYPNGNVERSFRIIDFKRCEQTEYFQDGKIKSEVTFYEGNAQKQVDYFPNGVVSYIEESEKNNDYLYKRNSYKEDGTPSIIFEIIDKKKKIYIHKEFFDNGKLKEEGEMKFSIDASDYIKEGVWTYYDESGKQIRKEKYASGSKIE
jgi:antitoxin component YwqK of YwqJK toxin-antitoxin module